MTRVDDIFKENLINIRNNGSLDENPRPKYESDGSPAHSVFITDVFEKYEPEETPITNLRPIAWKSAINELLAIYQTQTNTQEGFKSHNCNWWLPWMNEQGNIGRAYSYNLESHRNNEMQKEIVRVKERVVDDKYSELKEIGMVNPIQKSIDNNTYLDRYIVIGKSDKTDSRKREHYYIQFINTGYITELRKDQIGKSKSSDPYERTTYGIGYLGNYKSVCNLSETQVGILKDKWENMFRRCYSEKYEHRKLYENIFVHQEWHSLENFLRDVRHIPQYHLAKEDGFKGWDLDKDYFKSNAYSKDTCVFLKQSDNKLYSNAKPFTYDGKIYIRQTDFANDFETTQTYVSEALQEGSYRGKEIKFINDEYFYRYELSRNQINELLYGLKNDKFSRRHMTSFFNWSNQDKKMLVECAFMTMWSVRKIDEKYILDLSLTQRSSDYLVAGHVNTVQYKALQMMVAKHLGYEVGTFSRHTMNLHVYDRHFEQMDEILKREYKGNEPKLILNVPDGTDFYDISIDNFEMIGYNPIKPQLKFELGV